MDAIIRVKDGSEKVIKDCEEYEIIKHVVGVKVNGAYQYFNWDFVQFIVDVNVIGFGCMGE